LAAVLAAGAWANHRHRVVVAVGCVALASPLAAPLWRLETPLVWLQFPWRWLLPATLLLVPAVADPRGRRGPGLLCLLAPTLLLTWVSWVELPALRATDEWQAVGSTLYETLGANPLLVDVPENRPSSFGDLGRNLDRFGPDQHVVVSAGASISATHRWSPLERQVEITSEAPFTVGLRMLDYPWWSMESNTADVRPGGLPGVVSGRLPAGRHVVTVSWHGNPYASVGQLLAALTLAAVVLARRRLREVAE
jgi:hypothetical protein